MRSSRLCLVKRLVLALPAIFVLGALSASMARAEPTRSLVWKVGSAVLEEGETKAMTIKDFETKAITLEAPTQKLKITCEAVKMGEDSFIADEGRRREQGQGYAEFNFEYSLCRVSGNGEKCTKLKEPIVTKKIRARFALNDTNPGFGEKILTELDPAAGSEKEWVELKFEGTSCKFANTLVKNLAFGLLWTDPNAGSGKETEIEQGSLPTPTTSYLIKFPDEPESVWLWSIESKKWELLKPSLLTVFNEKVKLEGTFLILLANGKEFGLAEEPMEEEKGGGTTEPTRALVWKVEGKVLTADETKSKILKQKQSL